MKNFFRACGSKAQQAFHLDQKTFQPLKEKQLLGKSYIKEKKFKKNFRFKPVSRYLIKIKEPSIRLILKILYFLEKVGFKNTFKGSKNFLIPEHVIWGRSAEDVKWPTLQDTEKMWNQFDDPGTAYLLIYPNPGGDSGQHAALVIGSSDGVSSSNEDIYVSWTFDEGNPLRCERYKSSFSYEHQHHGFPEVIPLKGLNIERMKQAWNELRASSKKYELFNLNCSKVSHLIIQAGIDPERQNLKEVREHSGLYNTPTDIRRYGYYLKQELEKKTNSRDTNKFHDDFISQPLHVRKIGLTNLYTERPPDGESDEP